MFQCNKSALSVYFGLGNGSGNVLHGNIPLSCALLEELFSRHGAQRGVSHLSKDVGTIGTDKLKRIVGYVILGCQK
jgi:hypothetical protein